MRKITLPKPNNFLYIGLLLMVIKVSFSLSVIISYSELADTILSLMAASCFVIYILQQKYTTKLLILYSVLGIAVLYSSLKVDNFDLFITVLVCLTIRKEDINRIINFIFKYETVFLCIHTGVAVLRNVILDESLNVVIDGVARYHFGMGHPNRFSLYLFNLVIMWVFLNFYRLNSYKVLVVGFVGVGSYFFTKTRTNVVEMIVLMVVLLTTIHFSQEGQKIVRRVAMVIVPIILGGFMFMVVSYTKGNSLITILDQLLSARIRLGAYAFEQDGITLFGQNINYDITWDETWRISAFTFDNIYTYLCMNQGVIWLVIIIALFYFLAKRTDSKYHFAIIAWALYGITEVHGLNGFLCFPILLLSVLFQNERNRSEIKKAEVYETDRGTE